MKGLRVVTELFEMLPLRSNNVHSPHIYRPPLPSFDCFNGEKICFPTQMGVGRIYHCGDPGTDLSPP